MSTLSSLFLYFHNECEDVSNKIDTQEYYVANRNVIKIEIASYGTFCILVISRLSVVYLNNE